MDSWGQWMIWLRLQQTLYTNCISESAFGLLSLLLFCFPLLSFCCAKILAQLLILLFPGKLLSPGLKMPDPKIQGSPSLTSTAQGCPAAHQLTDCCRSSARVSCWRCSSREGEMEPLLMSVTGRRPALWEWDAALLGCLLHSSLNTSVVVLHHFVSALSGGMGGDVEMNCSLCCLLFCPTFAC